AGSRNSWVFSLQKADDSRNGRHRICRLAGGLLDFRRQPVLALRFNPYNVHAAPECSINIDIHLIANKQRLGGMDAHAFKRVVKNHPMGLAPADFYRNTDGFESRSNAKPVERIVKR